MEEVLILAALAVLGRDPKVRAARVQQTGHLLRRRSHEELCHQRMGTRDAQVKLLVQDALLLQIAEGSRVQASWIPRMMLQWHHIRLPRHTREQKRDKQRGHH